MIVALYFWAAVLIVAGVGMAVVPMLAGNADRKKLLKRLDRVSGRDTLPAAGSVNVTVRRDVADSSIKLLDRLIKSTLPRPAALSERLASTGRRISLSEYILASLVTGGLPALASQEPKGAASVRPAVESCPETAWCVETAAPCSEAP